MQEFIDTNPMALMGPENYAIPVIFHILHRGEPIGVSPNINSSFVFVALEQLNSGFRDFSGDGATIAVILGLIH